ncbi:alanine racemase [Bacterioplanoides sp.]|uniref:alanine racemase n=1 Tax=Bacterioplanoides sp. TaxID=2066072 RepID=UPI003B0071F7
MTRPTQALINWSHFRHNYQLAKQKAAGRVYAVIKANGYGHGIVACARALGDADGFAVACVDEALLLREVGIKRPVLVLQGAYDATEWQQASAHDLQLVIHHSQQLAEREKAVLENPVGVWLKINSGMNRLGVRVEESEALLAAIEADEQLQLKHVMTHFADADTAQPEALADSMAAMQTQPWPVPLSVANSAATITQLAAEIETEDSISRPGIMLYGSSPLTNQKAAELGLKTVMSLRSQVIHTHEVKAGEKVGYGGDWTAEKDSRIAVVAIGYGDGYPRQAPCGTPIMINGHRCELVGRVSMDMITVDISEFDDIEIGDVVELWGEQIDVDEIASLCNTIAYELFCQLTPRVKRVAVES